MYFRCLDRNRDGSISQAEYHTSQRQLAAYARAPLPPPAVALTEDKISFDRWRLASAPWHSLILPPFTLPAARLSLA